MHSNQYVIIDVLSKKSLQKKRRKKMIEIAILALCGIIVVALKVHGVI